jgi:hypothetical protein
MHSVSVPYRSARTLRGCTRQPPTLRGLAGSTKKRNGDAFGGAFPGVDWRSDSQIVLPAKFGGVTVNRDKFDELAGTWYGATYHPDGDQAGWQQKFDAALKSIGAYNAFYGVPNPAPPTGLIPQPVLTVSPSPTPTPSPSPTPTPSVTASPSPTVTTLPATGNTPAITVNVPATVPPDNTAALISQMMAQGASQQQAFAAALQSLAAQGVQPTPQVQQQVANDVAAAANPQQANVMLLAGGAALVIVIGIIASRGKKRR